MELKWGSNQDEWSHPLKAVKMPKPNGALIWREQKKKWATVSSISKNLSRAGKIMWAEKVKCCHSM